MKHSFSSTGKPSCANVHEIPRVHSPAFQNLHGEVHMPVELDRRAATGVGGGGAAAAALLSDGCPTRLLAAAARAAAAFFSLSFNCCWRALWLSVNGSPGFNEVPPSNTRAPISLSAKLETSLKASGVMTCGSPTRFLSITHRRFSCCSALSKTLQKMLSNAL